MTQELSSLMDGELQAQEAERAIRSCCGNEELKQKWQAYHLIGEALRGDGPCRSASTRRIMEAIQQEPTVLAPPRRMPAHAGRIAFAAAASVATVAVVGWIGVQGRGPAEGQGATIARNAPAVQATPVAATLTVRQNSHQDYVVVHRQVPNADFYRAASNTAAAGR